MAAEVKKSRISAADARSHTRNPGSSQLSLALGGEAPEFLERRVHQAEQLSDSNVTGGEVLNSESLLLVAGSFNHVTRLVDNSP